MSDNTKGSSRITAFLGNIKTEKTVNIIAIALLVIFIPILVLNTVLLIKTVIAPNEVPSIGNNIPLIVLTESMEPKIHDGDLILVKKTDIEDIKEGDVISFFDPESNSNSVVTHRIYAIETDDEGKTCYRTVGDNNDLPDRLPVPADNVIGVWSGFSVRFLGRLMLFTQTVPGLLVCIGIPALCFIVYEVIRRRRLDSAKQSDIDALKAELEAMKAEKNAVGEGAPADTAAPEAKAEDDSRD